MELPLLYRLAVALAIGLIVGLERGWKTREEHGGLRPAGVRTFTLTGLFGGATAALTPSVSVIVLAAGLIAVGALVVAGYLLSSRKHQDFGLTTELALLATYVLGAGAVAGYPFEAAAAAIVMTLALGLKTEAHRVVAGLERSELLATLQLLLIAAVLVPLLPSADLGPFGAVNPRTIGVLVLLITGISYVGYFSVRVLGARLGVLLTAFFGGLSSSTAVTLAYARRARDAEQGGALFSAAIAIAAATMVPRLAVEIAAVNAGILARLWPSLLAAAVVPMLYAAWALRPGGAGEPGAAIELSNPLQLRAALVFGLVLAALFVASAGLEARLGNAGIYATAAIAGSVDVDAIGLTLARNAAQGSSEIAAARGIVIAVVVNTAVKGALAAVIGGQRLARRITLVLGLSVIAAGITGALTLR
jgi:uncharacterized membrane protein (DUF4010 family)